MNEEELKQQQEKQEKNEKKAAVAKSVFKGIGAVIKGISDAMDGMTMGR